MEANSWIYGKSELKNAGIGIFATKDFEMGEEILRNPFLRIKNKKLPYDLSFYVFDGRLDGYCDLVMGAGSFMNHADNPNVEYAFESFTDRFYIFKAKMPILKGEEMFISYGVERAMSEGLTKVKDK